MNEKLLQMTLGFGVLFCVVFGLQYFIIGFTSQVRFDYIRTDLFFVLSSYVICLHFIFFSRLNKLKPQLGFIYLPTLFIKGLLFYIIFKDSVFSIDKLTLHERLHLLAPLLIFLVLEVYFVARIINLKTP